MKKIGIFLIAAAALILICTFVAASVNTLNTDIIGGAGLPTFLMRFNEFRLLNSSAIVSAIIGIILVIVVKKDK